MELDNIIIKFKDHVLTKIIDQENFKVFDFAKPETGIYYQRWILDRGKLIVTGDCYSSVYSWNSSSISIDFLASCGMSYFNEKCVSDKDGRYQKVFNSEDAEIQVKEIVCENLYYNKELTEIDEEEWKKMDLESRFESLKPDIIDNTTNEDYEIDSLFYFEMENDLYDFIMNTKNKYLFGDDPWEYFPLTTLTPTPYFHLAALKVANEKYPNN